MSDEFADSLDAGDAPGWKPEEGDVIVGTVVALSKGWSDYQGGRFYPIVTIKPDLADCKPEPRSDALPGEPVAIHGFQFVLEDRFTALRPMPGERIGIKMGPKTPTQDGKRTVQTYTVKMERSEDIWNDIKNPRLQGGKRAAAGQPTTQTDDDIPF